ncbi:DNA (cytosine-5-)-methyltransferase [Niabella yanshanensis]|uniref:Cytosine-specific methyltransferase n=1 Tax=Niabella yanshanensis TaxID=577386 RepID=A0ABZ0W8X3_9BACT|nr:DNA (cytosine-5-)-methyltransferase [Niabella yanshanensis]WQD39058.1 DNA (cytosine-5-)-methyltransferase [Niabella yanshanensis]
MAAIDLYSGIGGWTLGLKMAGIEVLSSYEWWKDANNTHNKNFNSAHQEVNIRTLELAMLPDPELVNYVVGSPPCTQFSLANRGGKGDINDGLVDIRKFLEVVEHMQPIYWAMENVPRVAGILEKELAPEGSLHQFAHLFGDIKVYNSSDFGVPQDRKRMIAGRLPFHLLDAYKNRTPRVTLGDVLRSLSTIPYTDPVYGFTLEEERMTDHLLEANLTAEEQRINRDAKTYHPVYNRMSFPDRQDRPSRTVTALCTRVSRESIIIEDAQQNIRRLTIRERGCLQSFPINYQYFSNTYAGKIKMIGNAIPPALTFYIAQAMQETPIGEVLLTNSEQVRERLVLGTEQAITTVPENAGAHYPWSRSFCLAIPGLRFGSGVRFELKNYHNRETRTTSWRVNFFYGTSKAIKAKQLDLELFERAYELIEELAVEGLPASLTRFQTFIQGVNENEVQLNWSNVNRDLMGPIFLTDELSRYANEFRTLLESELKDTDLIASFIERELKNDKGKMDNKRILDNHLDMFVGILIGTIFNSVLQERVVHIALPDPQLV